MWDQWFSTDWATVGGVVASTVCVYAAIILYVRIAGLRSFSKMTAPDFAMTVAVGSLFATSIASPSPTVLTALLALAMLFLGQFVIARVRLASIASGGLDNDPVLLVHHGELIEDRMRACGVTEADIRSKLREANAGRLDDVHAVVFEATGDVSVLHGGSGVDDWVLSDVRGFDG